MDKYYYDVEVKMIQKIGQSLTILIYLNLKTEMKLQNFFKMQYGQKTPLLVMVQMATLVKLNVKNFSVTIGIQ